MSGLRITELPAVGVAPVGARLEIDGPDGSASIPATAAAIGAVPAAMLSVANDAALFALVVGDLPGQVRAGHMRRVNATGMYYLLVDEAQVANTSFAGWCNLPPAGPAIVQFRRGTFAELQGVVLAEGEAGWATDTKRLYVGDGVTPGGIAQPHRGQISGEKGTNGAPNGSFTGGVGGLPGQVLLGGGNGGAAFPFSNGADGGAGGTIDVRGGYVAAPGGAPAPAGSVITRGDGSGGGTINTKGGASPGGSAGGAILTYGDGARGGNISTYSSNSTRGGDIELHAVGNNQGTDIKLAGLGLVITGGTGTPEGVVSARVGSIYLRTDGGATTTLYVKTSGTGNTGWTAK